MQGDQGKRSENDPVGNRVGHDQPLVPQGAPAGKLGVILLQRAGGPRADEQDLRGRPKTGRVKGAAAGRGQTPGQERIKGGGGEGNEVRDEPIKDAEFEHQHEHVADRIAGADAPHREERAYLDIERDDRKDAQQHQRKLVEHALPLLQGADKGARNRIEDRFIHGSLLYWGQSARTASLMRWSDSMVSGSASRSTDCARSNAAVCA